MMKQKRDRLAALLSHEWIAGALGAALLIGALVLGSGWLSGLLAVLAIVLIGGSLVHLARLRGAWKRYPPPGRLIDVKGCRIHVLAEGEAGTNLPIVMFGGGHAAGLVMMHLHKDLRQQTRSILIDRPGTGWSATGAFPRTTAREAEEMIDTLAALGERGPFVFAGYSFGGLLAANIARRRPDLVARLVMLDATPLETLVFGPRLGAIGAMRRDAFMTGLVRLFGPNIDFSRLRIRRNPAYQGSTNDFEQVLGDQTMTTLRGIEVSAGSRFADWSILRELESDHIGRVGWETVVYDGDLGDLPLWLVAPGNASEVAAEPEVGSAMGAEQARMLRFYATTRERYMAASSRSRRIVTPEGTTHQFVYQRPEFVLEVLREAIQP